MTIPDVLHIEQDLLGDDDHNMTVAKALTLQAHLDAAKKAPKQPLIEIRQPRVSKLDMLMLGTVAVAIPVTGIYYLIQYLRKR